MCVEQLVALEASAASGTAALVHHALMLPKRLLPLGVTATASVQAALAHSLAQLKVKRRRHS